MGFWPFQVLALLSVGKKGCFGPFKAYFVTKPL